MYRMFQNIGEFIKLSLFSKKEANSIGAKLLISVLILSSFFVVLQTLARLHTDYQSGLSAIEKSIEQLNNSNKGSLSRSIWEVNENQTLSIIQGMQEMPNVSRIVVKEITYGTEKESILAYTGILPESNFLKKTLPIEFDNNGVISDIGSLTLVMSLEELYKDLYGTVISVVIFQMVKTFLMSAFILAIFHYLVTRHLLIMAQFAKNTNESNLDELLTLDRNVTGSNDEITDMLMAINGTKKNLKKLVESSEISLHLKMDIAKREEREASQEKFSKQIEAKNIKLAESNSQLELTISDLKTTQDDLVTAQKMAALGGMVKGVAHELNTPIGLSITAISHIQSDTVDLTTGLANNQMKRSDLEEYLEITANLSKSIIVGLDKAASLIRSFKLVSVAQHEELNQVFNVRSNLADILYSINSSVKNKDIKIINQIPEDINIASFPGVFYQIYTNLINNAVLHAFEGKAAGEIKIFARFDNNELFITFTDNGLGMSKDTVMKVFDPFFTTKRARGGTGLGMSIIYNLIKEKLFGSIVVESEEGRGTRYNITIPNLETRASAVAQDLS